MLFDTKTFHALEGGLNASWLQQQVVSQNLSNLETPNYKTKSVQFQDLLNKNMQGSSATSGDYAFQTSVNTEDNTNNRLDENNVDSDEQSMELYKSYVQYSYLTSKMNSQFSNFKYVVTNAFK
ncbi:MULTISPECIES: flagellar basal body rod protein FlgB [Caproicibacterium]|uniref:Flagellar basal body rod protein FlgB n=1 Tax=Caproicibacterium argilliputei TaxID=3030016 RepID=A0AA97D8M1_9FIRM|nr:flagellar basal body rod protein FlgB [Caproicibacterium argilliputei]WOC31289.1 flagellar basal body rod protein FlgB [Caproicibacterium argilliputei]